MQNRPPPRPGSLPLKEDDHTSTHERPEPHWKIAERSGYTMTEEQLAPFKDAFGDWIRRQDVEDTFTGLQKARAKAEELVGTVRTEAFDDWIRRCVVTADDPREWTQARTLYENYLKHGRTFGRTNTQKSLSIQTLATETRWGRMMASLFPKQRRGSGWHYPLRLKRGA